jgi:hypothetical protein
MPISANTLFHFTNSASALKGILQDNFRLSYCREEVSLGKKRGGYAAPMVSFCDIPLSQVKSHVASYGSYGIGLRRAWGVTSGLNPVLYISKHSLLASSYYRAFKAFAKVAVGADDWSDDQKALVDLLRYFKNEEGPLTRREQTVSKYRFADEREWRYVPPVSAACPMSLSLGRYDDPEERKVAESSIADLRLEFSPDDIKYIIIRDDEEIPEFLEHLRRSKGNKYTHTQVERLATRIITVEQVLEDM